MSSRAQRGSVADNRVFCSRDCKKQTEDNLRAHFLLLREFPWFFFTIEVRMVLYGLQSSRRTAHKHANHKVDANSFPLFLSHSLSHAQVSKIFKIFLSASLPQLVKACDYEQKVVSSNLLRHLFFSEDTKDLESG